MAHMTVNVMTPIKAGPNEMGLLKLVVYPSGAGAAGTWQGSTGEVMLRGSRQETKPV